MALVMTKGIVELRAAAAARVDDSAGAIRAKYITIAPGQEATYALKLADAKSYQAAANPADASAYPWIAAEAAATGKTPAQTAARIVATAQAWIVIGAQIEGARQAAKLSIAVSQTAAELYAAEQSFAAAVAEL
ncbi:hypothetical protein [Methylomonas sp. CM2]|uniref:hypothetical protein n=1 Tax=Methylomonas sp. CM2 TaxID=3417647 RepID=UPI003CF48941